MSLSFIYAVEFNVQPYLQNATPASIHIMWETDSGNQTIVNYGTSTNLNISVNGDSFISQGSNVIHDVNLVETT